MSFALVAAAAGAAGATVYFLQSRGTAAGPKVIQKIVQEARRDIAKNIERSQTAKDGPLAAIFKDSGWSNSVDIRDGKVLDWCGMSVGAWSYRAGMLPQHRRSFYATSNVRSFFSYTKKGNTHGRTAMEIDGKPIVQVHEAAGSMRRWSETTELRSARLDALDIQSGDVILIAHDGRTSSADHIALVESFDGRLLTTLEGNASGVLTSGKRTSSGVVRKTRDLADDRVRKTLFGVGRFSKVDFR